jgi:hypothetical protein
LRTAIALTALLVARTASAKCEGNVSTRLVPLPVYTTEPNEGSTYGAMPVFLRVCEPTAGTEAIIAPSFTYNDTIHFTGTVRYYGYPSEEEALTMIASFSTRINSNVLVRWLHLPLESGALTRQVELRWERSAFYRFFGLGPDTGAGDETSYTRLRAHANARFGVNLGRDWNAGLEILAHRDDVQDLGVSGLPLSRRVFPTAPGMAGSTTVGQAIDLRYDSRRAGDYSIDGAFADAGMGLVEGLANSPTFARGRLQLRALARETSFLSFAARFDASYVGSKNAAFYDQSSLGGSFLLRGFTENRFVDQNSWTVEVEQRVRILTTHLYGVTADWRIDPFVGVGQVFESVNHALSRPRPVAGVGLRAWVHPNVVGRVDVATGGEGLQVYVELGYPY